MRFGPLNALFLGTALCAWLMSSEAAAFCRSTTCDQVLDICQQDATGCITSGNPLFWPTACVSFGVETAGSPLRAIDAPTAQSVIADAFVEWISVDCGGVFPAIEIAPTDNVVCGLSEYNVDAANANAWVFRDDEWPYAVADTFDGTLALTFVTFNADTGEIYDADVEINSLETELTLGDVGIADDFASIAMHEVGHFLGLSHTDVAGATMSEDYQPGDTSLRSLEMDDIDGVCAAYPPGRAAEDNLAECEPRQGFSQYCGGEEPVGSGGTGGSVSTGTGSGSGTGTGSVSATGGDGAQPEPAPNAQSKDNDSGCSCRVPPATDPSPADAFVAAALLLLASKRRRVHRVSRSATRRPA